jgi:hypothetical protein
MMMPFGMINIGIAMFFLYFRFDGARPRPETLWFFCDLRNFSGARCTDRKERYSQYTQQSPENQDFNIAVF